MRPQPFNKCHMWYDAFNIIITLSYATVLPYQYIGVPTRETYAWPLNKKQSN